MKKVDILAIGVHPDDIELACSGTLLHHINLGKTVGLVDLTQGELGSRGTAALRLQEAANSAEMMGAIFRWNLGMADGYFNYTPDNINKVITAIRDCQPSIVLANSLEDRHPDHGRAAKLVADACYYSGLLRIETIGRDGKKQSKWRPNAVYHYIQDHNLTPDFVVDITPYMDEKIELILAFGSQFYNPKIETADNEVSTPISGQQFFDFLRAKAATYGRIANFDYAEGFNVARTPGVRNLFDLS